MVKLTITPLHPSPRGSIKLTWESSVSGVSHSYACRLRRLPTIKLFPETKFLK